MGIILRTQKKAAGHAARQRFINIALVSSDDNANIASYQILMQYLHFQFLMMRYLHFTAVVPKTSGMDTIQMHAALVKVLIAQRIRAGLRQCDVAARIGKPQSTVARIEHGERRVDVVEFVQLAMIIGFDPVRVLRRIVRNHGAARAQRWHQHQGPHHRRSSTRCTRIHLRDGA
jgi:DNA-binding XRE family transcriptional regulator